MKALQRVGLAVGLVVGLWLPVWAAEIVIYGFEGSPEGWVIPDWAKTSADYVGKDLSVTTESASEGKSTLKVDAEFPGGKWTGVYVEREVEVTDWTQFSGISADIYLPPEAPKGLKARFILTVGDQWTWTEMNRGLELAPGKWTTITAKLKPGSLDWKFFPDDQFRKNIRKLGIRVESEQATVYSGPVYIDNVRLAE